MYDSDINLNSNVQKIHQNSLDSLNSNGIFDGSNDSLNYNSNVDGSNFSLNSVDYPDEVKGELKGKFIQINSYKPESNYASSGILNYLKKLDEQYEKEVGNLVSVEDRKINKYTDKPVESMKKVAFKVFAPLLLIPIICTTMMIKGIQNHLVFVILVSFATFTLIYFYLFSKLSKYVSKSFNMTEDIVIDKRNINPNIASKRVPSKNINRT
ncbi:uncharacterized protein PMUG01_00063800 [Plasmodium malariae]|uniref:Uncharacterized protein n=1 Tax=Plasmodium malariae TaxID=5858 RepID=A0A1D3JHR3_PLAMA|nr:uncharacterized protein PMUG01_00063800 [Plasmodium malariae]SBT85837.1 hypothetical protein PMUG01_00063800 [Plasmodium malariae]